MSPDTPVSKVLRNGDLIIIQPSTIPTQNEPTAGKSNPIQPAHQQQQSSSKGDGTSIASHGEMLLREVADDNSCLFTSVSNLLGQGNRKPSFFRQIISQAILSNPTEYSEAVLGKAPMDYAAWIQSDHAWGGAIELAILADHFQVQLAAFDVHTMRLDRYAQDRDFGTIAFLIYDGIHYNYVALSLDGGRRKESDITQFNPKDEIAVEKIKKIAQTLHDNKQYTNTASFNLRCGQCGMSLTGEKHALEHAKATGHTQFDES